MALSQVPASMQEANAQFTGFKNRIINGAMMIDQRSAGGSTSVQTSTQYVSCDRWGVYNTQNSKCTVQQNAGSVTPPAGFKNYIGITSSSAYSSVAGDIFVLYQPIEGYNVADLSFGSASASQITVSFWVRSSLTGTFGGALQGPSNARCYPFTYTINSANTWEQKTITVVGDQSGSWAATNGVGLTVNFNLGCGSTYSGTAGSWSGTQYFSATGATSVVGTSGATFYITGVQLEKGSTATSFDYRPYGTELALCQRYFLKLQNDGSGSDLPYGTGLQINTTNSVCYFSFPVTMRSEPTAAVSSVAISDFANFTSDATAVSTNAGYNTAGIGFSHTASGAGQKPVFLTVKNNTTGYVSFSSEL